MSRRLAVASLALFASGTPAFVALPVEAVTAPVVAEAAGDDAEELTLDEAAHEAGATGEAVEVSSLTTPTELVTVQPDGTVTAELSAVPVRVPDQDGGWQAVNTDLELLSDGTLAPVAALADLSLSGGGDQPLAALDSARGSLSLGWPAPLPPPVLDGATATYPDVLDGVDLVVRANAAGFSTYVVVKTPEAADHPLLRELAFDVETEGVHLADQGDGTVAATDSEGTAIFETTQARMWDSRGLSEVAEEDATQLVEQSGSAREATVDVAVEDGSVVVSPDPALLESPVADFPIVIDPEWNVLSETRAAWAMVWSNGMDFYNPSGENARVGYDGWSGQNKKSRSFFRFELPAALDGARINSATFRHMLMHSPNWSCKLSAYGPGVQVWRSNNFSATPSWPGPTLLAQQDGNDRYASGHEDACGAVKREWDVTAGVKNANANGEKFVVFGMKSADESNREGWRKYDNTSQFPSLTVEYNRAPEIRQAPVVQHSMDTAPSATSVIYTNTAVPTLSAQVDDPDNDLVRACFTIQNTAGATVASPPCDNALPTADSAWTTSKASALAQPLAEGTYFAVVTVTDDIGWSVTGPKRKFIIDTTPPTIEGFDLSAPAADAGGWVKHGAPGTMLIDGNAEVVKYRYTVNNPTLTCAEGTSIGVSSGDSAQVSVIATQAQANTVRAVACDAANNQSAVSSTTFQAADFKQIHRWLWHQGSGADTAPTAQAGTHLTDVGGPGRTPGVYASQQDEPSADLALLLSGSGHYAKTTSPLATGGGSVTLTAWIKLPAVPSARMVIAAQTGTQADAFRLSVTPSGWEFAIRAADTATSTSTTATQTFSSSGCSPGVWCFVTGIYEAPTGAIRIATRPYGHSTVWRESASLTTAPPFRSQEPFMVGAGREPTGTVGGFLAGAVDSVRVFAGALSSTELSGVYAQTSE